MLRLSLLLGLLLQAAPRHWLLRRIAGHGPQSAGARFVAYFSGRVALDALAALPRFRRRVVLLPAYLCNVVAMAFTRQGWRVVGYEVDANFMPDEQALVRACAAECADLLLLAPLYGSEGGLAAWLAAPGRALRERLGVCLVLDLCQDAARLAPLTWRGDSLGTDWAVVTSFNDKSFPGVMGAALWTDLDLHEPPGPKTWHAMQLAARAGARLLPRRHAAEAGFEHSAARRFPYAFDVAGASRLQLALGAIGLHCLPRWMARRRAAVARGELRPLALPYSDTAPFLVVVGDDDPGCHRAKRPYALVDDARRSLRAGLQVRHNKGFDDR